MPPGPPHIGHEFQPAQRSDSYRFRHHTIQAHRQDRRQFAGHGHDTGEHRATVPGARCLEGPRGQTTQAAGGESAEGGEGHSGRSVTAPVEAELTVRAYFDSTPRA